LICQLQIHQTPLYFGVWQIDSSVSLCATRTSVGAFFMASKLIKTLSTVAFASIIALSTSVVDAKKFGGGKSVGSQRDTSAQRQSAAPTATPGAPAAAAAAAPAAAGAAAKTGMAKWAGPIAGIAAAVGLGYLFSQMGAGGFLGFMLIAILLIVGLGFLARNMMKKQASSANGAPMQANGAPMQANGAPMQYQTPQGEPMNRAPLGGAISGGAAVAAASGLAGGFGIPAGFDKAGFEDNAKKQFMALQAANDKGDLDAVRDFSTDEFYNQIAKDVIAGNKDATQVDELNAELLGIETDRGNYWASVQFTGKMREDGVMLASPFTETWNLVKPVDGSKGWLLAGIQQA
jgi:predicted lipid-binding transport protein (Tim44 family)